MVTTTPTGAVLLSLDGITHTFGRMRALDGAALQVRAGSLPSRQPALYLHVGLAGLAGGCRQDAWEGRSRLAGEGCAPEGMTST